MVPTLVLRVLNRKQAELEQAVARAAEVLAARERDLQHVVQTLKLLAGESPPSITKRPRRQTVNRTRVLLDVLRDAAGPLALEAVVDRYLSRSGLRTAGEDERQALTLAIRRSLGKLRDRGAIMTAPGPGRAYLWSIDTAHRSGATGDGRAANIHGT